MSFLYEMFSSTIFFQCGWSYEDDVDWLKRRLTLPRGTCNPRGNVLRSYFCLRGLVGTAELSNANKRFIMFLSTKFILPVVMDSPMTESLLAESLSISHHAFSEEGVSSLPAYLGR
jgi:hypothetical protein